METTKLPANFSCLEMKAQIQAKIYAEIKDMTAEERVAYFNAAMDEDPHRGSNTKKVVQRVTLRKKKELA